MDQKLICSLKNLSIETQKRINYYLHLILFSYQHLCHSYFLLASMGLVFWNSIHLEVASDSFCFLINCSWLLVFILYVFFMIFSGFYLYCWKGIHFSQNNFLIFLLFHIGIIFTFHFWFRDLLREFVKKYEVLLIILFLVFLLFLISEGLLFVSFFWTSFHSLSSPTLRTCPPEGFYLPDPCELTFANTLLLSNAAISLGITFTSLEVTSLFYLHLFLSFTLLYQVLYFHDCFSIIRVMLILELKEMNAAPKYAPQKFLKHKTVILFPAHYRILCKSEFFL